MSSSPLIHIHHTTTTINNNNHFNWLFLLLIFSHLKHVYCTNIHISSMIHGPPSSSTTHPSYIQQHVTLLDELNNYLINCLLFVFYLLFLLMLACIHTCWSVSTSMLLIYCHLTSITSSQQHTHIKILFFIFYFLMMVSTTTIYYFF